MSTTNSRSDDPQAHGNPPSEPNTPEQAPSEHQGAHNAFAWATLGLSAAAGTAGVLLCLMGHEEAGIELIKGGFLGGGIRLRK